MRRVPARVGLVGNPSDGYGGAVLATVVPDAAATMTASPAEQVHLEGPGKELVSAALSVLHDHLGDRLPEPGGITLRWSTDIARSVGLAGSSAIVVAAIDAAAATWGIELDRRVVAALALRAERDVLGIAAGWQDRIVQAFGATVLVDAGRMQEVDGVEVPDVQLPAAPSAMSIPLLVAWSVGASGASDDYHAPLRRNAAALAQPMAELAELARSAARSWQAGDVDAIAAAVDAGWCIRQSCAPLRADHAHLVELVRSCGIAATTPGSGGSVVGVIIDPAAATRAVAAVHDAGCQATTVAAG